MTYVYSTRRTDWAHDPPTTTPEGTVAHIIVRETPTGMLVTACGRRYHPLRVESDERGRKPVCKRCDAA